MANILVVDDEQDILETLPEVLKGWGHTAFTAHNGDEAIQTIEKKSVDLMITDIKMPQMDGLQLLEHVKKIDKRLVVIFLTGYPSLDSAITAMRAGAYDYQVKPVNLDELKLRIERGLERKEHIRAIRILKGLNWALIVSIPLWLILMIILAKILR